MHHICLSTFDFVWKMILIITLHCVLLLIVKIEFCRCVTPIYEKLLKPTNFQQNNSKIITYLYDSSSFVKLWVLGCLCVT